MKTYQLLLLTTAFTRTLTNNPGIFNSNFAVAQSVVSFESHEEAVKVAVQLNTQARAMMAANRPQDNGEQTYSITTAINLFSA